MGYDGLTIEAVARQAEVGRPTVYRRWSTKASLALAAVARSSGTPPIPDSGNLREDLVVLQRHQMTLMNSALFRTVAPALTAHFSVDAQLAESYVRDFVDLRRSAVRAVVQRAVARGELPGEVDADMLYDVLTGPLFYRAIARGERLDRKFVEAIVDLVILIPRPSARTETTQVEPAIGRERSTQNGTSFRKP